MILLSATAVCRDILSQGKKVYSFKLFFSLILDKLSNIKIQNRNNLEYKQAPQNGFSTHNYYT